MNTYLGPPEYLAVDQGSAYIYREMKEALEATSICMDEERIENPGTMRVVEIHQATLRAAYTKIREIVDIYMNDAECLQMDVFATNSTMGTGGLG